MYAIHKIPRRLRLFLAGALLVFAALCLLETALAGQASAPAAAAVNEEETAAAYLEQLGWQIERPAAEVCEVRIPATFDAVLERYNDLQLTQQMDLRPYCGQSALRCTFRLLNYPQPVGEVRANLLLVGGKVVAGDVCTAALNGFMHGLRPEDAGFSLSAFLPRSVA